jgi:hypothetical protein
MAIDDWHHPAPWHQGGNEIDGPGLFDGDGYLVLPLPLDPSPKQQKAIEDFLAKVNAGRT